MSQRDPGTECRHTPGGPNLGRTVR